MLRGFMSQSVIRWMESVARKLRRLEGSAAAVPKRAPIGFYGVITNAGPAGEADYTDHRYWVKRAVGSNTSGDITTAAKLGELPSSLSFPPGANASAHSVEAEFVMARIITATHLAEWVPGTDLGGHLLPLGTPVWVTTLYDSQPAPMRTRRFVFSTCSPHNFFPVKVTQTGGSAGDEGTQCDYTYDVTTIYGVELGAAMTPLKTRPPTGTMKAPDDESYGLGFYDELGVFQLYDANETLDTEACEE